MENTENARKLNDDDLKSVSGGYVVPSAQDCIDTCGNCEPDGYCMWYKCHVSEMVGKECSHASYF